VYAKSLSTFFTTVWFAKVFPELIKEHGLSKRVDIRCGFSKQFLTGKLTEKHTSQIWFKEGNIAEFTFNFGCGVFIGPANDANPLSLFSNMFKPQDEQDQAKKTENSDWKMYRSFFIATHGSAELDFKPSSFFNSEHFMQASINNLDFNIRELKVFKGQGTDEHEMVSEEAFYNERLQDMKSLLVGNPISSFISKIPFLQGIPMSPFPKYQRCLGMTLYDGTIEIMDRYVRIAFNIKL